MEKRIQVRVDEAMERALARLVRWLQKQPGVVGKIGKGTAIKYLLSRYMSKP